MKIIKVIKSKRTINILILLVIFTFYMFIYQFKMHFPCIFKSILGYSCPACGLSRGINRIFHMSIIDAIKYNILSIPVFIFILFSIIWVSIDIIKNDNSYINYILKFLEKWYIIIFIILFITTIINNINNV